MGFGQLDHDRVWEGGRGNALEPKKQSFSWNIEYGSHEMRTEWNMAYACQ